FAEAAETFLLIEVEVEVDLLIDRDRAQLVEALLLVDAEFGGDIAEDRVVPLVLLDELLAQSLAARTPELQIHKARAEHPDVPAPLQYVLGDDPLSAMAANRCRPGIHAGTLTSATDGHWRLASAGSP